MTKFLRLFNADDKEEALASSCTDFRNGKLLPQLFEIDPSSFRDIPGAPFAYWVSNDVRTTFTKFPNILSFGLEGSVGAQTSNNFRFLRLWWETAMKSQVGWTPYAKGGKYSKFFGPIDLLVRSKSNFHEIVAYANDAYPYLNGKARSLMHADEENFGDGGLTWTKSTTSPPSFRILPRQACYSDTGPTARGRDVERRLIFVLAAIMNSAPFKFLLTLSLGLAAEGRKHYEIGVINKNPIPNIDSDNQSRLADLAKRSWSLKRLLDTVSETSHSFHLPASLRKRIGDYDLGSVEAELCDIQSEIDEIAFELYRFCDSDRTAALGLSASIAQDSRDEAEDDEDDEADTAIESADGLLSWSVGVAFGRFDLRLATGKREAPPEPNAFDPLPTQSPGMLPHGDAPFHPHHGILVDDHGHEHDLPRLIEDVFAEGDVETPGDVRRWLRRDFFPLHVKQYSKSRRKAPIYWPLSTASGAYTLWLYYPSLTDQTLHAAVNDFIEPKLKQVAREATTLREKGTARSRDDDKALGAFQDLERELGELRDAMLRIAPSWKPNHDDGVQITAAPLYELFRHKPWQSVLKETWAKLTKGDYDWAHLAMAYWPERVREKCKTDKSLAIAHNLEDLYVAPEPKAAGRKKKGAKA